MFPGVHISSGNVGGGGTHVGTFPIDLPRPECALALPSPHTVPVQLRNRRDRVLHRLVVHQQRGALAAVLLQLCELRDGGRHLGVDAGDGAAPARELLDGRGLVRVEAGDGDGLAE